MSTVLKNLVAELAKGISTGIVLWSGRSDCPDCSPTLRCPDCFCGEGAKLLTNRNGELPYSFITLVFLCGLVVGYLGRGISFQQRRAGPTFVNQGALAEEAASALARRRR